MNCLFFSLENQRMMQWICMATAASLSWMPEKGTQWCLCRQSYNYHLLCSEILLQLHRLLFLAKALEQGRVPCLTTLSSISMFLLKNWHIIIHSITEFFFFLLKNLPSECGQFNSEYSSAVPDFPIETNVQLSGTCSKQYLVISREVLIGKKQLKKNMFINV